MTSLARFVIGNPRKVVAIWIALALAGAALGIGLENRVTNGGYEVPGSESAEANEIAAANFGDRSEARAYVVVRGAPEAALRRDAGEVRGAVADSPGVTSAGRPIASPDGSVVLVPVMIAGDLGAAQDYAAEIQEEVHALDFGPARADLIGEAAVYDRYRVHSKEDLTKAALISFPITLLILLAAFLSLAAATIPLALAGVCLAVTFGGLYLLTYAIDLNVFVEDIVLVLGLGLSIDFSLFLVTRVRECLARRPGEIEAAVTEALSTAGKAIAMSGVTVAASLAALPIIGVHFFSSMAVGAVLAVLIAVAVALTLGPAAIVLLAGRLDRFQIRPLAAAASSGRFWRRLAKFVVRYRIAVTTVVALALFIASIPALGLGIGFKTFSALPADDPVRQASEAAGEAFGPGAATPTFILTRGEGEEVRRIVSAQAGVVEARPPQGGAEGWSRVEAVLAASADDNAAQDAVKEMRSSLGPEALVGGPTAQSVDFSSRLDARTPLVVLVTLLLEVALLTALLRAPVIALKAAATTLLSVTATLGIVTLVFGDPGEIGFFVPVMLFTIVFGLSTDYEVFLLSRVRENYLQGKSNVESLEEALVRNSRAITLAGLTMAVVFFAFASSSLAAFTQIGFGVGIAILIDVTVVRGLLVPATVALLGDANWWWPGRRPAVRRSPAELG